MFRVGKEDIVVCAGFQHQSKLIKKTLWSLQFAAHVFQVLFQKLVSVFSKFSELYTAMSPMAIYRVIRKCNGFVIPPHAFKELYCRKNIIFKM